MIQLDSSKSDSQMQLKSKPTDVVGSVHLKTLRFLLQQKDSCMKLGDEKLSIIQS